MLPEKLSAERLRLALEPHVEAGKFQTKVQPADAREE